ncbi:MAG: hypothetical protein ACE5FU_00230, partial [Nitrospinota bacterium]
MKKKLCLMLTGAFFSVFASGCASSGTAPSGKTSHPEQPSWTKTGKYIKYPGSFYITGSGVSSKSFKEADDFARQELAKQIKVHVKGVDEITTSESREMIGETSRIKTRSNVRSAIKVEVNLLLEGIKISERWFDRDQGNYYSFAFLDREEAVKRLDLKLKEARIAASDLILRGEENEKKGKYFKALKNHLKAYSILKPLEPDILMRTVLAGELSEDSPFSEKGVSPSKAIRKIDKIISSLKLKKVSGDMQKARSNYPLDSPLVAKVVYESPDGLRPVQGLPVLFSFERGKGDLAREAWSDEFGVVKARVSHVESNGTGQNSIALSLNAQKVLASLTDEAPRLRAALSEKRIIFSYTFPSIYPQEQKAPLSRGQGLKELAGKLVNNIKGLKEVSVFQLVVFDFVELISQNRLTFSNTLENELKTNLALLRN